MLRETEHGPGESACPGAEASIALLGIGAAEGAVGGVKDGFVGGPAGLGIVMVAAFAIVNTVLGGRFRVGDEPGEEGDGLVPFAHEDMAQFMGQGEDAAGADSIDKEGVGAVEGVDEAAILVFGPAAGLDGTGDFYREFVEIEFALVVRGFAFEHEAAEVPVGGNVVETVVVDSDVADMGGHGCDGFFFPLFEEFLFTSGVKLEDCTASAEAFGPLCPAAGGVLACGGEDRGALGVVIVVPDEADLFPGELPEAVEFGLEVLWVEVVIDFHVSKSVGKS